jgi:hypothetical protein
MYIKNNNERTHSTKPSEWWGMKGLMFSITIVVMTTINGCFVYQDTTSWKQEFSKSTDYPYLSAGFELSQPQRLLVFPFLFVNYNKKKEVYAPNLEITTTDSANNLIGFRFFIYDSYGNKVLADSIGGLTQLNKILDYKAFTWDFKKEYLVKGLQEKAIGEKMTIDFEITLSYLNGSKQNFYFKQKELIKSRKKRFGSFF